MVGGMLGFGFRAMLVLQRDSGSGLRDFTPAMENQIHKEPEYDMEAWSMYTVQRFKGVIWVTPFAVAVLKRRY